MLGGVSPLCLHFSLYWGKLPCLVTASSRGIGGLSTSWSRGLALWPNLGRLWRASQRQSFHWGRGDLSWALHCSALLPAPSQAFFSTPPSHTGWSQGQGHSSKNVSTRKLPLRVCSPALGSSVSRDERWKGRQRTAPSGPHLESSLRV